LWPFGETNAAAMRGCGSKVEMSVSAPFWEFGGCNFDGHGGDEQARAERLDVLARLDSDRLTARAAAGLMKITPRQT
jgi:hypothetical protein